jgi:hypothetical protein
VVNAFFGIHFFIALIRRNSRIRRFGDVGSSRRVLLEISELLKFLVPFFRESIFTLLSLRETWKGENSMNKGVIQVDIGGQPPIPTGSHTIFILAIYFYLFGS